jgi:hypothetical protein
MYDGAAGLPVRLQFDDRLYRDYCQRLLEDHPGMVDLATFDEVPVVGRDDERQTVDAFGRGLLAGAARANDNELFVLVAAIPLEPANLERLLETVRVARAQHHRVLMIVVDAEPLAARFADDAARRTLAEERGRAASERYQELERRLTRLGSKIARMTDPKLMEKVAAEIELLRSGRARTVRGGR